MRTVLYGGRESRCAKAKKEWGGGGESEDAERTKVFGSKVLCYGYPVLRNP